MEMTDSDKTIDGFAYWIDNEENGVCYIPLNLCEKIMELLKEQEAEAEPGHWVVLENCSNAGVYCSECNTKIFDHYPMKKKYSYFCPHCGTRMEGQAVKWDV